MASSSDWVTAMAEPHPLSSGGTSAPSWLEAALEPAGFVEGLPTMRKSAVPLEPAAPEPEPLTQINDPLAEAHARGEAAGRAAAQAEQLAGTEHERALRASFRNLDQAAMDCLASELSQTVLALCEASFADYAPDPKALAERCRAAAERLGTPASDWSLHLNPADIASLDPEMTEHWQIVPDEGLARGGLRIESADGSIGDGPAEWRRAIAAAIRG